MIRPRPLTVVLLSLLFTSTTLVGQQLDCTCEDNIYVGEPRDASVHKFTVNADGTLTEINPDGPWYPGQGNASELPSPHGVGIDLNGNIYIGETNVDLPNNREDIRRLTCDGEIAPESDFAIEERLTAIAIVDNILFARSTVGLGSVNYYDLCTQTQLGTVDFRRSPDNASPNGLVFPQWPVARDVDGRLYAIAGTDEPLASRTDYVFSFTIEEVLAGRPIFPQFSGQAGTPQGRLFDLQTVFGLTVDSEDNVYFVSSRGFGNEGKIRKYSPTGEFIAETPIDDVEGDGGYFGITGLVYVPEADLIYSSNNTTTDDCVTVFSTDLQTITTAVGPVGGPGGNTSVVEAKAINHIRSCCPTPGANTIDTTLCGVFTGEEFNLQEFFTCDGIICSNNWTPDPTNTGFTYDDCLNSITVTAENTCGTFTLDGGGTGPSAQCDPFTITLNICVYTPPGGTITSQPATCAGDTPNTDGQILLTDPDLVTGYAVTPGVGFTTPPAVTPLAAGQTILRDDLPSTSETYTVRLFNTEADCFTDRIVQAGFEACACGGADDLGGNVFRDLDTDGTVDMGVEGGQPGVSVTVYDCNDMVICETETDTEGNWTCSGLMAGDSVRVEFGLPEGSGLADGFVGPDNGTAVQFTTVGTCDLSYAAFPASLFCDTEAETEIFISCYAYGSGDGANAGDDAIIAFTLDEDGIQMRNGGTADNVTPRATIGQVGSVWGQARDQQRQRTYFTSFLKRFSGFAEGPGHVFIVGEDGFVGSFDLQGVNGIDVGSVERNTTPGDVNELPDDQFGQAYDLDAFANVGKVSFGGTTISPDGNSLWTVNLNDRSLIQVDISDVSQVPTDGSAIDGSLVNVFPIDVAPCTNGEFRPFAIEFNGNIGYVGGTCDGSENQNPDNQEDLEAYLYAFDPGQLTTFTEVLRFPLNYLRENANGDVLFRAGDGGWHNWTDSYEAAVNAPFTTFALSGSADNPFGTRQVAYPMAIFSDIAFAPDGSATFALMDRWTHQGGANQFGTTTSGVTTGQAQGNVQYNESSPYSHLGGGEILKACFINGALVLENATNCVPQDPARGGTLSNDGPSGAGEFYYNEFYSFDGMNSNRVQHGETGLGAVTQVPGTNSVLHVVYDPIVESTGDRFNSGGIHYYSTDDGSFSPIFGGIGQYEILAPGTPFGKAAGLGAAAVNCAPAPIQIGNYVFIDEDEDGNQDACEPPVPGVEVQLFAPGATPADPPVLLATTVTDANGQYSFAGDGIGTAVWEDVEEDTLVPGNPYIVTFAGDNGLAADSDGRDTFSINGVLFTATTPDAGAGEQTDANDSDVTRQSISGTDVLAYQIMGSQTGTSNFTFDAGLIRVCPTVALAAPAEPLCTRDTIALEPLVESVTAPATYDYVWSSAGGGTFVDAAGMATTDYNLAVGYVPSTTEANAGMALLTLTGPDDVEGCPQVSDTVTLMLLNVNCGDFFWNGEDD